MVDIIFLIVSSRVMATNFFAFNINCFRTISNLAHKSCSLKTTGREWVPSLLNNRLSVLAVRPPLRSASTPVGCWGAQVGEKGQRGRRGFACRPGQSTRRASAPGQLIN